MSLHGQSSATDSSLPVRNSIRHKLFFSYILAILVPVFVFGLVSSTLFGKNLENNYIAYNDRLNDQLIRNIEENIKNLSRQSMSVYANQEDILAVLSASQSEINAGYMLSYQRLDYFFQSILHGNDRLDGLALVGTDGTVKYYSSKHNSQQKNYPVADEVWFRQTIESKGAPLLLEPHVNSFVLGTNDPVISIARPVINLRTDETVGVLLFDQQIRQFSAIFEHTGLEPGELIFVLGKTGDIIYTNHSAALPAADLMRQAEAKQGSRISFNGQSMLISSKASDAFGWQVITLLPYHIISDKSALFRTLNIILLILLVIITLVITLTLSAVIVKPLRRLTRGFQQLQSGDFDTQVSIQGTDELALIGGSFNQMVRKMKDLIAQRYELGILRKQAELEALQSKINPHFLFNTLNSIKVVSDSGDSGKTSIMVKSLADLFRTSMSQGQAIVRFADELDYVRKYLYLQECRFGGRYSVQTDVDDEVLDYAIPSMSLQPLIENALYHGLERMKENGHLQIAAKQVDELFIVYVSNNGPAIDQDRLAQINALLNQRPDEVSGQANGHQGIFNVNARIKLHFGAQYGMQLFSRAGSVTTVKLSLPAQSISEFTDSTEHLSVKTGSIGEKP